MSHVEVLERPVTDSRSEHSPRLVCPACRNLLSEMTGPVCDQYVTCEFCKHQLGTVNGIWRAVLPHRAAYFEEFMKNYRNIRAAEHRGSATAEFYLSLPYRDLTGANQSQWNIRARTFQYLEQKILPVLETSQHPLDVLDLGAGNGWLSYRLALRGHRPVAVDLMTDSRDGLGAARHFVAVLPKLFPRFQAELDNLPFADAQFNVVMFNASFHYSENYQRTLGEALRCLRPGGTVIIADTAWYSSEPSGAHMIAERKSAFVARFGTASDAIRSLEFLTDARLKSLEEQFGVTWQVHMPYYGMRWAARPLIAKLQRKREPSRFRIYTAEVSK